MGVLEARGDGLKKLAPSSRLHPGQALPLYLEADLAVREPHGTSLAGHITLDKGVIGVWTGGVRG